MSTYGTFVVFFVGSHITIIIMIKIVCVCVCLHSVLLSWNDFD